MALAGTKLDLLVEKHGPDAVALMRRIKDALDPHDLFNPGSTVPRPPTASPPTIAA